LPGGGFDFDPQGFSVDGEAVGVGNGFRAESSSPLNFQDAPFTQRSGVGKLPGIGFPDGNRLPLHQEFGPTVVTGAKGRLWIGDYLQVVERTATGSVAVLEVFLGVGVSEEIRITLPGNQVSERIFR